MPALHLRLWYHWSEERHTQGMGQRTRATDTAANIEMATLLPKVLSTTRTLCTQKDQDWVHVCVHRHADGPGFVYVLIFGNTQVALVVCRYIHTQTKDPLHTCTPQETDSAGALDMDSSHSQSSQTWGGHPCPTNHASLPDQRPHRPP